MVRFRRLLVLVLAAYATACGGRSSLASARDGPYAPAETRRLRDFGAIGDGLADDTAALGRALRASGRYCLDGGGLTYRVVGTLRAANNLCLRNVTLAQTLEPFDTSHYLRGACPTVDDTSAVVDCGDKPIPANQIGALGRSLSVRTLLIRSGEDRPLQVNLERVKIDRGRSTEGGSRSDAAGIWLDGASRVDFRDVEISGSGKGFGLFISNARNVTLTNLWIHDLIWSPYRGDTPLIEASVASIGWNRVPIREFRERGRDGVKTAKFYGVRIQEQVACAQLSDVHRVRIENIRIERCGARFDTGDLPWQADGLDIGRSSTDVVIRGARIESAWEGVDVAAGGSGIEGLKISDLDVTNTFSFGLKFGYALRNVRIDRPNIANAGLAGVVVYGPVRNLQMSNASISGVGFLRSNGRRWSPWPAGNRAGIRIDTGAGGASPENILVQDVNVSGAQSEYEFGLLKTGGDGVRVVRFRAEGFGRARAQGINLGR